MYSMYIYACTPGALTFYTYCPTVLYTLHHLLYFRASLLYLSLSLSPFLNPIKSLEASRRGRERRRTGYIFQQTIISLLHPHPHTDTHTHTSTHRRIQTRFIFSPFLPLLYYITFFRARELEVSRCILMKKFVTFLRHTQQQ